MATKPQSPGLLSKVANIFRAPDGREGGASGKDGEESQHSVAVDNEKNALQALIQRKRQDDLVRRREFNYLRTLRKSPHGPGRVGADGNERISTFAPSSGFTADDRASTLKKIDAIEAHMISSWARNKVTPVAPPPSGAPAFEYAPTVAAALRSEAPPSPSRGAAQAGPAASGEFDNMDLDFTGLLSAPGATAVDTWDTPTRGAPLTYELTAPAPLRKSAAPTVPEHGTSDFLQFNLSAKPKPIATVVPESLPEHIEAALQDAAIQFAEGDTASAEAVLLGLMQGDGLSTATADIVASALFDLYRATGQQDGFDVVAMDYAERFGRSPGEWFSLPERLQHAAAATLAVPTSQSHGGLLGSIWEAPEVLTVAAVVALRKQFAAAQLTWQMDWMSLSDIDPDGAQALGELMTFWCTHPVELQWTGIDILLEVLERHTPADNNTVDQIWWRLRMDALCILQRHDDFESLALDYCVVYEVSPPSWKLASCHCVQDQPLSEFGALADNPASVFGDDLSSLTGPFAACELDGEIIGEAPETMAKLQAAGASSDHVVVSCALVMRLDFSAAGGVLNWAIDRQAKGCQVQFIQVPRLVAVFFHMLGIDRYAQILVRAN